MAFRRRAFPLASMALRLIRSTLRPSNLESSFCMCSCSNKPHRASGERNQEVDILGARRLDEHGSEQFKFGDLPLPTKRFQLSLVNRQPLHECHISRITRSDEWFANKLARAPSLDGPAGFERMSLSWRQLTWFKRALAAKVRNVSRLGSHSILH